jgi:hypothetical protein
MLAAPSVAIVVGFILGMALLALTLWSARFVTPAHGELGPFVVVGAMTVGLILGFALMFGYQRLAPESFAYFGVALVAGFVVVLGVTAVRMLSDTLKDDKRR